ncbi:hypothetical protein DESC_720169 [Desulfosarcina cetonica]|nr:hypothetical protein DESC_720169 [Desulfosarcina cetonica]
MPSARSEVNTAGPFEQPQGQNAQDGAGHRAADKGGYQGQQGDGLAHEDRGDKKRADHRRDDAGADDFTGRRHPGPAHEAIGDAGQKGADHPAGKGQQGAHAHGIAQDGDHHGGQHGPPGAQQDRRQDVDEMLGGVHLGDADGKSGVRGQGDADGHQNNGIGGLAGGQGCACG